MPLQRSATTTDLANRALDALGHVRAITDVESDTSEAAMAVRRAFWDVWDATIRGGLWNFARTRKSIAALAQEPPFEFTKYYQLPADFLNIVDIYNACQGERWKVETLPGSDVRVIACDIASPLQLIYSRRVNTIDRADPLFIETFVEGLASVLAMPITRKLEIQDAKTALWQMKMSASLRADSREDSGDPLPESEWATVRRA